jgi:hypothetical protein
MAPADTIISRRGLGGLGAAALTVAAMGAVKAAVTPAAAQTAPSGGHSQASPHFYLMIPTQ